MTLQKSALAVGAAFAAGLAFADLTPIENLNLTTNNWFSAPSTGGSWSPAAPGAGTTSGYLEVDSTSAEPLTFDVSATSETTNVISEVAFDMLAAYVPQTVTLATPAAETKIGFAIKKTDASTAEYYAYLGSEWAALDTATTPVEEGALCALKIQIDRRYNPNKVQFLVNGTSIGGWKAMSASLTSTAAVDFVGSGEIKDLVGKKFTIVSEKIEVNPTGQGGNVVVVIPEASMADINQKAAAAGQTTSVYLNSDSAISGLRRIDAQVLFSKPDPDAGTDKAVVKASPAAQSAAGKVRIQVAGLNVQNVGGATVKYELQGSTNGTDGWTQVIETTSVDALEFPQNTSYRFFRVITTVNYGNN